MYNPLPFLPKRFQRLIGSLRDLKISPRLVFYTMGALATLWFLIRVIPKPSRAGYPCMRATAPFMSGFVLYLISLAASVTTYRQFRRHLSASRYFNAALFLCGALFFFFLTFVRFPGLSNAGSRAGSVGFFTPNQPIGVAKGIFPGRVVWMWNPTATNENCTNTSNENGVIDAGDNAWFMAKNNNPAVLDSMMERCLWGLTGRTDPAKAWDTIFRFFNQTHGNGNSGYSAGQKIFIKINATTAYGGLASHRFNADLGRTDSLSVNDFASETNPFVVLSVLRQLVNFAGVPEDMIYVGDPARNVYKENFDMWHNEFPGVHVFGNNLIHPEIPVVSLGRTPVVISAADKVFFSDHGTVMPDAVTDKLFTIFDEMTYLINIPAMKAHAVAGITLAAKNHFGSFTREWAMHMHKGLMDNADDPVRLGYGLYRVQTDIMMHKLLSGKNLLIIVDGLYPSDEAQAVPKKWTSLPFSNNWCSSLFMSLDPVAIESVCHDFLRTEYNGPTLATSRPNWYGVDDYLHQAADSSLWPDNIVYDPDNDGVLIASLGVHEHWNDSLHKQYTRNLGTGFGIELFKAHEHIPGAISENEILHFLVYPNPAENLLHIYDPDHRLRSFELLDMRGETLMQGKIPEQAAANVNISELKSGVYFLRLSGACKESVIRFVKR